MRRRLAMTVALVLGLALVPATTTLGTSGTLLISVDTVLTEDHMGHIDVVSDGVTLDCDGHSVIATPGDKSVGIRVVGRTDVTVRNCHLTGFDRIDPFLGVGFRIAQSSKITVEDNTAEANEIGFLIGSTQDSKFRNNSAIHNLTQGFFVHAGSSGNVFRSNSTVNSNRGFEITAANNTLLRNTSTNDHIGFWIRQGAVGNLFDKNAASSYTFAGFVLDSSGVSDNTLTGNAATAPLRDTYGFFVAASGNTLANNRATGNDTGFFVVGGTGNTLENNTAAGNLFGFHLFEASNNHLEGNDAGGNPDVAFFLDFGSNNTLDSNRAVDSKHGFVATGSINITFTNNLALRNTNNGYRLVDSVNGVFDKNRSIRNGAFGFHLPGGSGNIYTDNLAVNNGADGYWVPLATSENNTFTSNTAISNGRFGINDDTLPGGTNLYALNVCGGNGLGPSDPLGLCVP